MEVKIRETSEIDIKEIIKIEKTAFGYDREAELVVDMLADPTAKPYLSLMAFCNETSVGHVLFSRVYIKGQSRQLLAYILAPLAVMPKYQGKGIGGFLIKTGLQLLKKEGAELVFVLGHNNYYPKFGFKPFAGQLGYPAPFPIPEEYSDCWMVQSLTSDISEIAKGQIQCSDVLNKIEHWSNHM